tara:strand:+ start:793 stop:948 length:156 start_codon:yes stop_codon:yes gene_type:complete
MREILNVTTLWNKKGKHAKLHEVMRVCNPVNFVIESLEEFENPEGIELINL